MEKEFKNIEDLLTEESILSWYLDPGSESFNYWEEWANKTNENRQLLNDVKKILQSIQFKNEPISELALNKYWQQLLNEIVQKETIKEYKQLNKFHRKPFYISVAAVAAVFVIAIGLFWFNKDIINNKLKTNYGQIKEKLLPDSSLVILNANSKIVAKNFNAGHDREVWLDGEAYFKVHKTIAKDKFIVHTNKIDIVVTGTQFNVYSRDNKTRVYLREGSILVKSKTGDDWLKMKPGDYLTIENNQLAPLKEATDKVVLDWQNKQMVFDNTPLINVGQRIKEVYGINVNIADDIKNEQITGIMPNDNLSVLLKAFEASQEFSVTQTDKEIIISKK